MTWLQVGLAVRMAITVLVSLLVETAPVRGVTKLPGPMSVSLQETPDPLGEKLQVPVIAYATG